MRGNVTRNEGTRGRGVLHPTALPPYRLTSAPNPVPKPTVAALIPLSLLEALRNLDTPVEDGMEELAEEIVVRRLGLSPTVAAQIQRYRQTAERGGSIELDEVLSVIRLVGRRPDAALVFADAGRRAARYAARSRGRSSRTLARMSPPGMALRITLRSVARLTRLIFEGELLSRPPVVEFKMTAPSRSWRCRAGRPVPSRVGLSGAAARTHRLRGSPAARALSPRGDEACCWRTATAEVYE